MFGVWEPVSAQDPACLLQQAALSEALVQLSSPLPPHFPLTYIFFPHSTASLTEHVYEVNSPPVLVIENTPSSVPQGPCYHPPSKQNSPGGGEESARPAQTVHTCRTCVHTGTHCTHMCKPTQLVQHRPRSVV